MNDDSDAKWRAAIEMLRGAARVPFAGDLARGKSEVGAELSNCHCGRKRWVCEAHPATAFDDCNCGAPATPCACNPDGELPAGWVALRSAGELEERARHLETAEGLALKTRTRN